MELAMIGLGRMGGNMVTRLLKGGHRVVAFDREEAPILAAEQQGAEGAHSLDELIAKLAPPRVVWVMLPAGTVTETSLCELFARLSPGDSVLDGGNSRYTDSIRHAALAKEHGIHFLDVGTSGGIWGAANGYCMMIGGDADVVERLRPIFATLAPAPDSGWGRVGPHGAGHFVKMVHNGIEYGMMQAYAEGFALLQRKEAFGLDLQQIAGIWQDGSVVRSWLLDLTAAALEKNPTLEGIAPYVPDSGEGRWTAIEGIELGLALPVITLSLQQRFVSQEASSFADKLLAAMRQQFGGHAVKKE